MRVTTLFAVGGLALTVTACSKDANPAAPCSVNGAVSSTSFGPEGGTSSIAVSTRASCGWSLTGDPWITPERRSGEGPATVNLTIAANPDGAVRTGNISLNEQRTVITQSGCSARMSNLSADLPVEGASIPAAI